jgi:hypothetical protein
MIPVTITAGDEAPDIRGYVSPGAVAAVWPSPGDPATTRIVMSWGYTIRVRESAGAIAQMVDTALEAHQEPIV